MLTFLIIGALALAFIYWRLRVTNMDVPASAERAVEPGKDWNGRERHEPPGIGHNGPPSPIGPDE